MATEFFDGMKAIRKSLKKAAEDVHYINSKAKIANVSEAKKFTEDLMKDVKKLMQLESEAAKMERIIETMITDLKESSDDIPTDSELKCLYNKIKEDTNNAEGDQEYFKEIIKSIRDEKNDKDEMEVMQVQYSRVDPISKKDIANPVINKNCGHVYDRDSIHEFAGRKRTIQCAIQGCSETITIANLTDFPDYWKNVK